MVDATIMPNAEYGALAGGSTGWCDGGWSMPSSRRSGAAIGRMICARRRLASRAPTESFWCQVQMLGRDGRALFVVGVAWWRVREWLDRRAGRQGAEPVTLAIGDVPVCPPGPAG